MLSRGIVSRESTGYHRAAEPRSVLTRHQVCFKQMIIRHLSLYFCSPVSYRLSNIGESEDYLKCHNKAEKCPPGLDDEEIYCLFL